MENAQQLTVNIEDEMRQSYMDYAMSVIVGRALPDVRDGMKPVQRRILYAMFSEGLVSGKKHSKCAGVVGEVLKRFHPHGDMPVYEALVRLAQPWNLRYPLVDGQGNFGSIDGDPAAAYRYTECRMTALAEHMLEDIEKETVDFTPNFDDSTLEPLVLPARIPNLLVNGADGIAVGMATHMPPHNLVEVANAIIEFLEDPQVTLSRIMQHVPGPDFPTGGIISGRSSIISAYAEGKGVVQVRARTHFESVKAKSREAEAIIISEIPFQVNKSRLLEKIEELCNSGDLDGISRFRDESDRTGMRIVIELKRDATREIVLNQLFKLTPLQTSFGIINLAIVEGKPVICSLLDLIRHFVDHRRDIITRRTQFDLKKARERMHLLEGFRVVLLHIDDVVQLIKKSDTPQIAREGLEKAYELSTIQAQAVLDLRLQKLTGMEQLAIQKEHEELGKEIERLVGILSDPRQVDALIKADLLDIKNQFGDARRTEISDEVNEIQVEDLIEDEEMVVSISHQGYVKRTPIAVYRAQKRGGRGVTAASLKEEDFVEHLYVTSTLSYLLVFTSLGRVYWQKVYEIPESSRTARGRALVNLLSMKEDETMTAILPVREFVENQFVVMATKHGVIKKVGLMEFSRTRRSGVVACGLRENDALVGACITGGDDDIILATRTGLAIRFSEQDVREMGRAATGVRGIRLEDGDFVVGMTVGRNQSDGNPESADPVPDANATLLTVCENGYGKRTLVEDYRRQGRGGKGIIDIRTTDRNGPVVEVCAIRNEDDGLIIITSSGKMIRIKAKDVSVIGRNTQGVRLINLEGEEIVVAVAHVVEGDE